jgi:hypothetical protein
LLLAVAGLSRLKTTLSGGKRDCARLALWRSAHPSPACWRARDRRALRHGVLRHPHTARVPPRTRGLSPLPSPQKNAPRGGIFLWRRERQLYCPANTGNTQPIPPLIPLPVCTSFRSVRADGARPYLGGTSGRSAPQRVSRAHERSLCIMGRNAVPASGYARGSSTSRSRSTEETLRKHWNGLA